MSKVLERAVEESRSKHRNDINQDERVAIALGYLQGKLTLVGISRAMGRKTSSATTAYLVIATGCQEAWRRGLLKIVDSPSQK